MNTAVARRPAFEREGTPSLARTEKPDAKPRSRPPDSERPAVLLSDAVIWQASLRIPSKPSPRETFVSPGLSFCGPPLAWPRIAIRPDNDSLGVLSVPHMHLWSPRAA